MGLFGIKGYSFWDALGNESPAEAKERARLEDERQQQQQLDTARTIAAMKANGMSDADIAASYQQMGLPAPGGLLSAPAAAQAAPAAAPRPGIIGSAAPGANVGDYSPILSEPKDSPNITSIIGNLNDLGRQDAAQQAGAAQPQQAAQAAPQGAGDIGSVLHSIIWRPDGNGGERHASEQELVNDPHFNAFMQSPVFNPIMTQALAEAKQVRPNIGIAPDGVPFDSNNPNELSKVHPKLDTGQMTVWDQSLNGGKGGMRVTNVPGYTDALQGSSAADAAGKAMYGTPQEIHGMGGQTYTMNPYQFATQFKNGVGGESPDVVNNDRDNRMAIIQKNGVIQGQLNDLAVTDQHLAQAYQFFGPDGKGRFGPGAAIFNNISFAMNNHDPAAEQAALVWNTLQSLAAQTIHAYGSGSGISDNDMRMAQRVNGMQFINVNRDAFVEALQWARQRLAAQRGGLQSQMVNPDAVAPIHSAGPPTPVPGYYGGSSGGDSNTGGGGGGGGGHSSGSGGGAAPAPAAPHASAPTQSHKLTPAQRKALEEKARRLGLAR